MVLEAVVENYLCAHAYVRLVAFGVQIIYHKNGSYGAVVRLNVLSYAALDQSFVSMYCHISYIRNYVFHYEHLDENVMLNVD